MNSNSVFAETKKERQLKELAFLSILYFCVTVAIVTLMTLIYDVISTGYSRLFNDYELGLISKVAIDNPVFCDVTDVADHFDHVVKLVGIDHVAFGSDYDGVGDTLPYGLKDASTFPNLIYHLLKRGYSEEDIEKICYKNIWRVWKATEEFAELN